MWLAGPLSGHPASVGPRGREREGEGGQLAFPCCHGKGAGAQWRGGAAGCLLLVALALYVVDLFQWCEVETERTLGGVQGKITG